MEKEGHRCTSIQGDMEPEQRDRVVDEFRKGTTKILIATDVLSRGFDVTQVSAAISHSSTPKQIHLLPPHKYGSTLSATQQYVSVAGTHS